jgi:hypothetical protein
MAKYEGFTCDSCGAVHSNEDRTKVTIKFDGPLHNGAYVKELCADCVVVPDGVTLKPLRTPRTVATATPATPETPAPTAAAPADVADAFDPVPAGVGG